MQKYCFIMWYLECNLQNVWQNTFITLIYIYWSIMKIFIKILLELYYRIIYMYIYENITEKKYLKNNYF